MEGILLDRNHPQTEFTLSSPESYLLIKRITLLTTEHTKNGWAILLSSLRLTAELNYRVYSDANSRFYDERTLRLPINISIDPNKSQPVFELNHMIKNEIFTIGNNPLDKFYTHLKLELEETSQISDEFKLILEVEKHRIDEG